MSSTVQFWIEENDDGKGNEYTDETDKGHQIGCHSRRQHGCTQFPEGIEYHGEEGAIGAHVVVVEEGILGFFTEIGISGDEVHGGGEGTVCCSFVGGQSF